MTASDEVGAGRSTEDRESASVEEGRSTRDGDRSPADVARSSSTEVAQSSSTDADKPSPADVDRTSVTVYRWTCPICGESRTGMASGDEDPLGKAEFSLRQHVQTTDGDGHGSTNTYPPGFDPDTAGRAVSVN